MKNLFLLLFLITSQFLFAQDHRRLNFSNPEQHYHQFEENATCYLIADNVNVRDQASSKGKVIANIPIGTEIKILQKADETLKLNGFETNWYKVEFKTQDKIQSGYVWGGLIADRYVVSAYDGNLKFMSAIASYKGEKKESYTTYVAKIQLRACKNNKEIAKIEFDTRGSLEIYHQLETFGDKGLSNVKEVIMFSVSEQMCAGTNANETVFWDGSKLIFVLQQRPGGDAPYFSSDYLIYPNDEGGKKDRIFREEMTGEVTEDGESIETHKKVEYQWTGTELKQIKVLINKEYEAK